METAALLASQTAQTVTCLIQRESPGAGWSYFQSETLPDDQPGALADIQEQEIPGVGPEMPPGVYLRTRPGRIQGPETRDG